MSILELTPKEENCIGNAPLAAQQNASERFVGFPMNTSTESQETKSFHQTCRSFRRPGFEGLSYDWRIRAGMTQSRLDNQQDPTGPQTGFDPFTGNPAGYGDSGGSYIYIEASNPAQEGDFARSVFRISLMKENPVPPHVCQNWFRTGPTGTL